MTPHVHHDELIQEGDCEEHQTPEGLLDLLALSFHFDLGEGHLEYFPQVDRAHLNSKAEILLLDDLQVPLGPIQNTQMDIISTQAGEICFNIMFLSRNSGSFAPLRGPPQNA